MAGLEQDLKKIKKIAREKENENWDFRANLKMQDMDKIDKIVHRLNKEVSEQIDCLKCANCCISLSTEMNDADVIRAAKSKKMDKATFINEFLYWNEDEGLYSVKDVPCTFLEGKLCTIYKDRPIGCADYPYLHKSEFITKLMGVIGNYESCPIVYNVYEQLKKELRYRYRGY